MTNATATAAERGVSDAGKLERAVYVDDLEVLEKIDLRAGRRLYFGEEFCQKRLPTPAAIESAELAARDRGWGFTLVTPYMCDETLPRLSRLLETVCGSDREVEVVFNDWGVLRLLERFFPSVQPVMGRLLNRQRKDPRVTRLVDAGNVAAWDSFRHASADSRLLKVLLKRFGIQRAEFDLPPLGLSRPPDAYLRGSLHVPYAYLSTTRLCPLMSPVGVKRVFVGECGSACKALRFDLRHEEFPSPLLFAGNTVFARVDPRGLCAAFGRAKNLLALRIDRVVERVPGGAERQPELLHLDGAALAEKERDRAQSETGRPLPPGTPGTPGTPGFDSDGV